jgi:hypothetical protein
MFDTTPQEQYLAYALSRLPKQSADEVLIMCRRVNYIVTSCANADGYYYDSNVTDTDMIALSDVATADLVFEQLKIIYKMQ